MFDASGLTLTLRADVAGTFVVTYRVTDGEAFSSVATVTVVCDASLAASDGDG